MIACWIEWVEQGNTAAKIVDAGHSINHYVTAVGLPRLKVEYEANGDRKLVTAPTLKGLPSAFQTHLDERMKRRTQKG